MKIVNLSGIRVDGSMDAPASAMTKGMAVVKDSATIDECATTERPYGFLMVDVTTDGLSYEEKLFLASKDAEEIKVSDGKIPVLVFEPGLIATDNDSGETWAVGDVIFAVAGGLLAKQSGAATGDIAIGTVTGINKTYGGSSGMSEITLSHDLDPAT
jgi:hypothetical protein